jgi:DNA-binding MarR family transcriptional regulator
MVENEITLKVLMTLRRIMRAVSLNSKKLEKNYNLTGPQLILLNEIAKSGEVAIGALATTVTLSNPTTSGIVDRLEKRGLVVRTRGSDDRRKVFVGITASGRETLGSAPPPLQAQFIEEFGRLGPEEQRNILSALEKVALMINAEHLEVAPVLSGQPLDDNDKNSN